MYNVVCVEDGGWKYYVDLDEAHCTCGDFRCKHLKLALDVKQGSGYEHRYILLSAMHKEIRQSNVQSAYGYAGLLTKIHNEKFISTYCQKIAFEETRNPLLLEHLGHNWEGDIISVASSLKKWEIPDRRGHVVRKSKAYQRAWLRKEQKVQTLNLWNKGGYYEALEEFFLLRMLDDKSQTYRKKMFELLYQLDPSNPIGRKTINLKRKEKLHVYECIAGLEWFYGLAGGDAYIEAPTPVLMDHHLEYPADYSHDLHTFTGKAAIQRHWNRIRPNERLPAGLDLRWTGSILGYLWRETAFHQFGLEYKDKRWQDVKIDAEDWRQAKILDSYFYKDLYRTLEPSALLS